VAAELRGRGRGGEEAAPDAAPSPWVRPAPLDSISPPHLLNSIAAYKSP
jgi:hypothetical protein